MHDKSRVEWIDAVKEFATICVVIGHVVDGYIGAEMYPDHTNVLRNIFDIIYIFHMPLFFAISGMTYRLAYFKPSVGGCGAEK